MCVCDRKGVRGDWDVSKAGWVHCVHVGGGGLMDMSTSPGVIEQSRENDMIYARLDLTFLAFFISTECLDMARSFFRA